MRKIVFSSRSKKQLFSLLDYLESTFSETIVAKFISKLDKVILIIQKNPDTFATSNKYSVIRKCVISKQTTLFYKYNTNEVRLLSFFDTRQNPTKIKTIK